MLPLRTSFCGTLVLLRSILLCGGRSGKLGRPFLFVLTVMVIRHSYLKNTEVNTELGLVKLDSRGLVRNLVDFEKPLAFLKIPDFLNAELFPPEGLKPGQPVWPEDEEKKLNPSDDEYWTVIQELEASPEALNSEGYVDIELLNRRLREKRLRPLTGPRRKEITLRRRREGLPYSDS